MKNETIFRLWSVLPTFLVGISLLTLPPSNANTGTLPSLVDKIIAQSGDAYIAYDPTTLTWEIGTAGIARRMDFDPGNGYRLQSFFNKSTNREWLAAESGYGAELHMILNGDEIFGASRDFQFVRYSTKRNSDASLELHVEFTRTGLTAHFYYLAFPKTSVIEQWVAVENTSRDATHDLTSLDSFSVALRPSEDTLTLYWVQGSSSFLRQPASREPLPSLRLRSLKLTDGTSQKLGGTGRSSEHSMGWFALANRTHGDGVFGGIEWSGTWQMNVWREHNKTWLNAGIGEIRIRLAPQEIFESPRRFVGFYQGNLDDAANASHEFARTYLMRPRQNNFPWTQYNTWFAYDVDYDEAFLRREVDQAAAWGLEIFYIDAGWYEGSPQSGDFSLGLGTWRESTKKFPSGLRALSDYIHSKGMKFGLWVEPERVDLAYAGEGKEIPYEWLAPDARTVPTNDSGLARAAQVCLGHPAARAWMKSWLTRLVRDYEIDWLKWDYNIWMSCDQPEALGDGNYRHILGLYEVLDDLRAKFPNLIIENCASGGNRMDYALLRRTDVAWLSDQTEPSYRVRYHAAGASYPFPPEYLNAWLIESPIELLESAKEPNVFRAWLRSRMMGAFGLSLKSQVLTPDQRAIVGEEIARYKSVREIIAQGKIFRLLPQTEMNADLESPADSDGAEFYSESNQAGVVFLFLGTTPWERRRLLLRGLDPNTRYQVVTTDRTMVLTRTGQQLMRAGITFPYDASRPSVTLYLTPLP